MKWKCNLGFFRLKLKLSFGKGQTGYKLPDPVPIDPEARLEEKLYRLFSKEYCEFFPGKQDQRFPSCLVYYKGCEDEKCKKYLIGEILFGELKIDFFKRKGIIIEEDIKRYRIKQKDRTLVKFDKEWVEVQGQYQ